MRRDIAAVRRGLIYFAIGTTIGSAAFGWYAVHRQHITDARAEQVRQGLCDAFSRIPGQIPPAIVSDRQKFARPGHPKDCQPLHPLPEPTVIVREIPRRGKPRTVTLVVVPTQTTVTGSSSAPHSSPSPSPSPTASHTPKPHPSHSPSPKPSPSPSPSCDLFHPSLSCIVT